MALQFSVAVRNARLNAIATAISTSPYLRVYTGAAPATCATTEAGTLLASIALPSTWMSAAASGTMSLTGTWQTLSAAATGTAAHFRIYDTALANCHWQGTVGTSATDMIVDSVNFTAGQQFTVTALTLTEGNA